ncbi:arylsulfatase [Dysgonomonas termitidis]|uniref:Arylsulfatase n=1 Tax=Dysgonomonas termitidis TaxID=1516126 RepID=A0ABV9L450_9BACT
MKVSRKFSYLGLAFAGASAISNAQEKPNIIVILADDMGYSDLGCYGGEVETPNLDKLAEDGIRYRQFYNSARSCPSRAALMTGLYPHQAGMGWMAAANLQRPPYQGFLNNECVTIAEVLRTAGYKTYMSGKWHLSSDRQNEGAVMDNWPNQRGFDKFYGIVGGAANYFETVVNINNKRVETPKDGSFYFTHAISDNAINYIDKHNFSESPFFLYLAYNAPHWPLHALEKDIEKYVQRYKAGWDQLRAERFERQQKMGLFGSDAVLSPRDQAVEAWDKLTPEQQHEFTMRMAIYAAQIDAMDQGIGRLVEKLKEKGQSDNTIIMFMADNGACAEFISGGKRKAVDGKQDTYESYRINWANLSSTPYREYKHYTNEGGIASPLIVHYPAGIDKKLNRSFVNEYGHFTDIMATCVDLSGAEYPKNYKGHQITPMQGVSLVPNFKGGTTNRDITFWEHEANIAVRDGKWKIVSKTDEGTRYDESSVKLYDMEADPTEMTDLSGKFPERRARMYEWWKQWADRIGVTPMDTRGYGQRQQAYKRDDINGEFDDNFGDWNIVTKDGADVRFSIDTVNTISGRKTARIDIKKKGRKPNSSLMKWVFNTGKENAVATVSFKGRSDKTSTIFFRVEEAGNQAAKALDKEITLTKELQTFDFKDIPIPDKGRYQIVFYVGASGNTSWIDDVRLIVK